MAFCVIFLYVDLYSNELGRILGKRKNWRENVTSCLLFFMLHAVRGHFAQPEGGLKWCEENGR